MAFALLLGGSMMSCSKSSDDEPTPDPKSKPKPKPNPKPVVNTGIDITIPNSKHATSVRVLADKEAIYMVGYTSSDRNDKSSLKDFKGGYHDIYMIKMDLKGKLIWEKCFGTKGSDIPVEAHFDSKGNIVVFGNRSIYRYTLGKLQNSTYKSQAAITCISKDGKETWNHVVSPKKGAKMHGGVVDGDAAKVFFGYYMAYGNGCCEINLNNKQTSNSNVFANEIYNFNRVRKDTDGGYLLMGEFNHDACLMKLSSNFNLKWETQLKGGKHDVINDVAIVSDGYLAVGETFSNGIGYGNGGRAPYYRVVHEPRTKGSEVLIAKIDSQGVIKNFHRNKKGEGTNNIGWMIGVGYLESGWKQEYEGKKYNGIYVKGTNYQPDYGVFVDAVSSDECLILGTGTRHVGKASTTGNGKNGVPEQGLVSFKINTNYMMRGKRSPNFGGTYNIWEEEFYESVLKKKAYHDFSKAINDVFSEGSKYYFLSKKDGNIHIFSKSRLIF